MNLADITRVVAKIKFLALYTCSKCGRKEQGGTTCVEIDSHDASALTDALQNQQLNPHQMPVGWGSYYAPRGNDFRCPACQGASA